MELEKIEEDIYLSIRDKARPLKSKVLNAIIEEEVRKRKYLSEDWQVGYAVEKIKERIDDYVEEKSLEEKTKKEENNETLLQILRRRFKNNKVFNHFGAVSVIFGIIGFFIASLILGVFAIVSGVMAKREKQKFGIIGIVLGIIDIIGMIVVIFKSTGMSEKDVMEIIVTGFIGAAYMLLSDSKRKKK